MQLVEQRIRAEIHVVLRMQRAPPAGASLEAGRLVLQVLRESQLPWQAVVQQHLVPQHDDEARRLGVPKLRQPQLLVALGVQLELVPLQETAGIAGCSGLF